MSHASNRTITVCKCWEIFFSGELGVWADAVQCYHDALDDGLPFDSLWVQSLQALQSLAITNDQPVPWPVSPYIYLANAVLHRMLATHFCYIVRFPWEPGLASSPQFSSPTCSEENLGGKFFYRLDGIVQPTCIFLRNWEYWSTMCQRQFQSPNSDWLKYT